MTLCRKKTGVNKHVVFHSAPSQGCHYVVIGKIIDWLTTPMPNDRRRRRWFLFVEHNNEHNAIIVNTTRSQITYHKDVPPLILCYM